VQFFHSIDVQQRGTVDSDPSVWRQLRFQIGNAEIDDVMLSGNGGECHLIFGVKMSDLRNVEELDAIPHSRCDADEIFGFALHQHAPNLREYPAKIAAGFSPAKNALEFVQSALQIFHVDGFQEVVDGINFECIQSISIVSSRENDQRLRLANMFQKLETRHAWHLDIKKEDIRMKFPNLF